MQQYEPYSLLSERARTSHFVGEHISGHSSDRLPKYPLSTERNVQRMGFGKIVAEIASIDVF